MVPIYTQFLRVITYANMPQELRIVKNMSYFLCFCTNFVHILNQILQRYSKNRIFMTCSHCLERERSQGGSGQRPVLKVPITQEKVYGVDFLFACMGRVRYVSNYSTYTGVGRQTKRDDHFERCFNIHYFGNLPK